MSEYTGYLAPYASLIKAMAERGMNHIQIAAELAASGVKSPYADTSYWSTESNQRAMAAMVKYVMRGGPPPKKKGAKWQVWTPEMQEEEFRREYAQ